MQDRTGPYHANGKGNTIRIDYQLSSSTTVCAQFPSTFNFVEFVPRTIQYGYDTNGANPTRKVVLVYAESAPGTSAPGRSDIQCSFVSGLGVVSSKLLTRIDVSGPNPTAMATLKSYKLRYNEDGGSVTGRTRLTSVEECDQGGICKAPARFEYQAESAREAVTGELRTGAEEAHRRRHSGGQRKGRWRWRKIGGGVDRLSAIN